MPKITNQLAHLAFTIVAVLPVALFPGLVYAYAWLGLCMGLLAEYKEWSNEDTDKTVWQSLTTDGSLTDILFYIIGCVLVWVVVFVLM